MKKKITAIILMIITCVACAFGFAACSDDTADVPADGNMAKVVLKESNSGLLSYYDSKWATVLGWGTELITNYTLDDIIGTNLPYKNYGGIYVRWNKGGYKITKIEFDVTVKENFKAKAGVGQRNSYVYSELNVAAGQTQHISFNVDLQRNDYDITISFGVGNDEVMRLVDTKISNFYVTAEKV